jgi:hypothetical protein
MTRPKHAPRVPFALLLAGLIVGGMSLLLLLNTASAANEVKRHDIAVQDDSIAAQVQELQNQVAESAAPQNLAAAAAALGMVPALNPAFLVVASDGAVRVLGSPAAASPPYVAPPPAPHTHPASPTKSSSPSAAKTAPATSTTTTTKTAGTPKNTGSSTPASPPASPSSTPTPTVTLPGGNR